MHIGTMKETRPMPPPVMARKRQNVHRLTEQSVKADPNKERSAARMTVRRRPMPATMAPPARFNAMAPTIKEPTAVAVVHV